MQLHGVCPPITAEKNEAFLVQEDPNKEENQGLCFKALSVGRVKVGHDGMQVHPTHPVKGCFVAREKTYKNMERVLQDGLKRSWT